MLSYFKLILILLVEFGKSIGAGLKKSYRLGFKKGVNIGIVILLIIYFTSGLTNIAFCDFTNLDDFIQRGHNARIEILINVINNSPDLEFLEGLYGELHDIYLQHQYSIPYSEVTDDFSSIEERKPYLQNSWSWRQFVLNLLLFIILTILGVIFRDYILINPAILFYQNKISTLLYIFQEHPDIFIEPLTEFYTDLMDNGIL